MLKTLRVVALVALASAGASLGRGKIMDIKWDELPALPPSPGQSRQAGLAGPFAGAQGDVLFVGGGANFPDKAPWEGGTKAWWSDLFVLERHAGGRAQWVADKHFKLPRPIAYGMSFSTPDGVICAGGCDAAQCYRDVFQLSWNAATREVVTTPLPPLPAPLGFHFGAMVGQTIFVAGGQQTMKDAVPSSAFFALDLSQRGRPDKFRWETLPAWPGPPRIVPVAAASGGKFYLFGGRDFHAGRPTDMLTDAYVLDPAVRSWKKIAGLPLGVMAGTAMTAPDGEILIFSGDRGDLFLKLEAYDLEVEALRKKMSDASADRAALQREVEAQLLAKKKIYDTHPGFGREVLGYNPTTNAWRVVARSPVPGQVTTIAVPWGGAIVIPNGEVRPGIRTADVTQLTLINR
jgi:cyclically-permuted mutarotase family protein